MIKYDNILVPTDFSVGFDVSLKNAIEFAKSFGSTLHIVHVVQNMIYPVSIELGNANFTELDKELSASANQYLKKVSEQLKEQNVNHTIALRHGNPANEVIEYANSNNIDLIVIATHGSSGFEHFLFGSTTEKVLRKAHCPVFVVRFPKS